MNNPKRRLYHPLTAVLAVFFPFGTTAILAAPGDLDPTFGNGGIVRPFNANGTPDASFGANGVAHAGYFHVVTGARQRGGKLLVLGWGNVGREFAISRLVGDLVALGPFTLSGRVISPGGQGVRNAIVSISNNLGIAQTTVTSAFGYYSFDNIGPGTYTISVTSRRYQFATRTLAMADNLAGVEFVGQDQEGR